MFKRKKKTIIKLEAEIVAVNEKTKVFRVGGSDTITIPSDWQLLLDMKDCKVEKRLLKVKVPYGKIGPLKLSTLETHVLMIAPIGFPFETFERTD